MPWPRESSEVTGQWRQGNIWVLRFHPMELVALGFLWGLCKASRTVRRRKR